MEDKAAGYLGERAEQLAIVYLSRRDDLVITRQPGPDDGLDLLVWLTKHGKPIRRVFGVQVKALRSQKQVRLVSPDTAEIQLQSRSIRIPLGTPFPLPLCLFVFTMDNDEGFYEWLKNPHYFLGIDGMVRRITHKTKVFRRLDDKAINDIVLEVNRWYDERSRRPA